MERTIQTITYKLPLTATNNGEGWHVTDADGQEIGDFDSYVVAESFIDYLTLLQSGKENVITLEMELYARQRGEVGT